MKSQLNCFLNVALIFSSIFFIHAQDSEKQAVFKSFVDSDSVYVFANELSLPNNTYKGAFSKDFKEFHFLQEKVNKQSLGTFVVL